MYTCLTNHHHVGFKVLQHLNKEIVDLETCLDGSPCSRSCPGPQNLASANSYHHSNFQDSKTTLSKTSNYYQEIPGFWPFSHHSRIFSNIRNKDRHKHIHPFLHHQESASTTVSFLHVTSWPLQISALCGSFLAIFSR